MCEIRFCSNPIIEVEGSANPSTRFETLKWRRQCSRSRGCVTARIRQVQLRVEALGSIV